MLCDCDLTLDWIVRRVTVSDTVPHVRLVPRANVQNLAFDGDVGVGQFYAYNGTSYIYQQCPVEMPNKHAKKNASKFGGHLVFNCPCFKCVAPLACSLIC